MSDYRTVGIAVAVGTLTAAGLTYLYLRRHNEPIPTKWKKVGEIIDLNFFPLKSCAPIKNESFECHVLGMKYESLIDRCFIVSRDGKHVIGQAYPKMVLIQPTIIGNQLILSAPDQPDFVLNLDKLNEKPVTTKIECLYSKVDGIDAGDDVSKWLSEFLNGKPDKFRLVFYPYSYATRGVAKKNRVYKELKDEDAGTYHGKTSYMLINEASVDELNTHLENAVKPIQYRPNMLVKGPSAYEEDNWKWVKVGDDVIFQVLKPYIRCIFTTTDPETGIRHPNREPLNTLIKNRTLAPNQKGVMGIQLGIRATGQISIGDDVYINDDSKE